MRKSRRIIIVLGVLFVVAFSSAAYLRTKYIPAILMYHSVCPNPAPKNLLAVSVSSFERQMRFLKERRYNVITIESLADLIRQKKKIPPKSIAITFDDGYKDNYTYAFPILKKYKLPATIFIITNEVGRPDGSRLNWEEILAMRDSGLISFGSHCLGPEPLTKIKSQEEVKRQIFASKAVLEEKLGRKVNIFSYPEGRFNAIIKQLVIDAGYQAAVATNPGKRFPSDDIFALKRLRISANCNNPFVFWIETSGYYNFMREYKRK